MRQRRMLSAIAIVVIAIGISYAFFPTIGLKWASAQAINPMTTFTVQLDGAHEGWDVYEFVILGEGGKGKDHWGWPYDKAGVYDEKGSVRLRREQQWTWIPIGSDGTVSFSIPNAKSAKISGVARIIKRSAPGATDGVHGVAGFTNVTWPGT